MQLTTAFSRPQTVPPVPSRVPAKSIWILNSWRDLVLYVGTPILLIPLFALAQMRWSAQDIYIFVAAFGAMGHHLPGMIRAYGDRALFERFRWRFVFAPIFLLCVCVAFTWWDLKGIVLIVFFWGVWHGMMQTYGFCRIYDAKTGSFAAITRRLDFAACAIWFAAAVLLSSSRMTDTLKAYYASGGPYIAPWLFQAAQRGVLTVAIVVSILFLLNFGRMWLSGNRPNPVKLALLVTSIAFWWFCNNGVANILAGIALFEVFHDVQYLSLVWIYNRNRVEKDSSIGGFMRFVFRRSGSLVGLYIGLVLAYGSLGFLKEHIDIETIKRVLTGVVAASGLLHFYYDGFIWKVRERSTRESLGLSGGTAVVTAKGFLPSWAIHGLKWAVVFVLPLGAFWAGQMRGAMPGLERARWIVNDLPVGAMPRYDYGASLKESGRLDEAADQFRTALSFNPKEDKGHFSLATVLLRQSKTGEATRHLSEALRLNPSIGDYHAEYGYALELTGRKDEAAAEYAQALRLSPKSALVHYDYGMFLWRDRKVAEASAEFERALRLDPNYVDAHIDFGNLLYEKGDLEGAKSHYQTAIHLAPKRAAVHNMLGIVLARQGLNSQAILQFAEVLELEPNDVYAAENLRRAQAADARFQGNGNIPR
jgi:Tfp pilus assembly protein PilF